MALSIDLAGKKALVTGGGRGLGRAIALALAEAGADVAITARTKSQLADAASEIEARGRKAAPIVCDVTDPAAVDAMVGEAVDRLGGLCTSWSTTRGSKRPSRPPTPPTRTSPTF